MTVTPSRRLTAASDADNTRPVGRALKRGFLGRCPNCGKGHILYRYLKVQDRCEVCGEDFSHHRADDAPPYFTILIVAHITGIAMVAVLSAWDIPMWLDEIFWPAMVIALSLVLLPRIKGALIAFQWAARIHRFGEAKVVLSTGRQR